eukprot:4975089-Ditylum_brightwellii.AAC.1
MEKKSYKKGTKIIRMGDIGEFFYVVDSGNIQFEKLEGVPLGSIGRGGTFGELALLYDCPRSVTCIAITDVVLWRVDQMTVRNVKATYAVKDQAAGDAISKIPFLAPLHQSLRDWL